jgi:DNA-binding IclR family transcriptional regulator
MSKLRTRILKALKEAPWPVPVDELVRQTKFTVAEVSGDLHQLAKCGILKKRTSPDDRFYSEWWLVEDEHLFRIHLSIKAIGENNDY